MDDVAEALFGSGTAVGGEAGGGVQLRARLPRATAAAAVPPGPQRPPHCRRPLPAPPLRPRGQVRFGLAFCEASGECKVRWDGNDDALIKLATDNAAAIGAGHSFIMFLDQAYPGGGGGGGG